MGLRYSGRVTAVVPLLLAPFIDNNLRMNDVLSVLTPDSAGLLVGLDLGITRLSPSNLPLYRPWDNGLHALFEQDDGTREAETMKQIGCFF